jgi:hypothetical protein
MQVEGGAVSDAAPRSPSTPQPALPDSLSVYFSSLDFLALPNGERPRSIWASG